MAVSASPADDAAREAPTERSAALPDCALDLHQVCQQRAGVTLLDRIDLRIKARALTCLIGPSGAGKTSLLRLLNRLDQPQSGQIHLFGEALEAIDVRTLRRRVGFVFQTPVMLKGSVTDNLQIALRLAGGPLASTLDCNTMLERVELGPSFATRDAMSLSGGERQRLALARALMTGPQVLLLDEPTAALDTEGALRLMALLIQLRDSHGLTMIMATHRLAEAAAASDDAVMLEHGRVLEHTRTEALFRCANNPRTRAFLSQSATAA